MSGEDCHVKGWRLATFLLPLCSLRKVPTENNVFVIFLSLLPERNNYSRRICIQAEKLQDFVVTIASF